MGDEHFSQNDIPLPDTLLGHGQGGGAGSDPPMVATLLMRSPQVAVPPGLIDTSALLERGRGEKGRTLYPMPPVPMHNVCMHPYLDSQKTCEAYGSNTLITAVTIR